MILPKSHMINIIKCVLIIPHPLEHTFLHNLLLIFETRMAIMTNQHQHHDCEEDTLC